MPFVRLDGHTKRVLEDLAGADYSMDEIINILIDDFGYEDEIDPE